MTGYFKCPVCGHIYQGKITADYYCGGAEVGKARHDSAAVVFLREFKSKEALLPGPYWRQA